MAGVDPRDITDADSEYYNDAQADSGPPQPTLSVPAVSIIQHYNVGPFANYFEACRSWS